MHFGPVSSVLDAYLRPVAEQQLTGRDVVSHDGRVVQGSESLCVSHVGTRTKVQQHLIAMDRSGGRELYKSIKGCHDSHCVTFTLCFMLCCNWKLSAVEMMHCM